MNPFAGEYLRTLARNWLEEIVYGKKIFLSQITMPLILLLLYVQFVLIGLNFPLFDSRELVLYLVWLPLVFVPYIFTRKTIIYRVITALLLIPVSINFFHIIVTSRPFTVSSLFILLNTNAGEAIEFTDTVHWWRVLLLSTELKRKVTAGEVNAAAYYIAIATTGSQLVVTGH